ncbi:hypothetical protein DL96DRAFT_1821634 [Flagelloscypha sp. PMI_526]|nr:hypothetical protein DL96DRAFT_1821634 [Flagelloscypha sp. PMI_526]
MLSGARHHVRVLLISRRASHSTIARNPTTSNTFRSIESTQGPHESSPHEHPRPDSWEHRAKVVGKLHSITKPPSKPRFANAKTKPARTTPVLLSQNWQNAALEAALKAHSKGHRRIALRVPDQPQRKTELYGALLTQTPSAEGRSKYLILANSPDKMATIASELSPLLPNDKILLQWKGGNKGARLFQRVSHLPNVVMHSTGHETIYITTYRQDRLQDQLRLWRTQFATVILDDCQVPQPKGAQALFSRLVGRDPRQPFVRRVKNLEPTVYGITSVKNTAHVELKAFFDTLCYRYNELEVWRDELPRPLIFSSIRLTLDLESIRDS